MLGCRTTESKGPTSEPRSEGSETVIALYQGPLHHYVPAPTLRWLLLAEPARLASHPGLLNALEPLVDSSAWQRFIDRNGFDLREQPGSVVAGFDLGTLYLLDAGRAGASIEQSFRGRLLRGEEVSHPHPQVTRVRGVVGTTPQALLHAEHHLVALSTGDPSLVRLVEGYLLNRFRKTPRALEGAVLRAHAQFASDAPLRLWVPEPERLALSGWLEPFGAETTFLAAVELFEIAEAGEENASAPGLRLHMAVAGPWDPAQIPAEQLRQRWDSLAQSPVGSLLRLHPPLRSPILTTQTAGADIRIELSVELALGPVLRGLRDLLAGEMSELL